ncbi:MAG: hypothetical protein ABJE66_35035 [Deltaproteobacteria bacterium]
MIVDHARLPEDQGHDADDGRRRTEPEIDPVACRVAEDREHCEIDRRSADNGDLPAVQPKMRTVRSALESRVDPR